MTSWVSWSPWESGAMYGSLVMRSVRCLNSIRHCILYCIKLCKALEKLPIDQECSQFYLMDYFYALTVHLKVKGKTSFPRSGSPSVKESRPKTWLEEFPNEQEPVLVTLLWYSFKQSLKKVLHGVGQREATAVRAAPPQHSPLISSPRGLAISNTWSSKKPEPCAHWNKKGF